MLMGVYPMAYERSNNDCVTAKHVAYVGCVDEVRSGLTYPGGMSVSRNSSPMQVDVPCRGCFVPNGVARNGFLEVESRQKLDGAGRKQVEQG